MWENDLSLYGPQVAAVVTGLIAAATGAPRDLPRPFGMVTALIGVAALVAVDRWVAGDCLEEGACSAGAFWIVWVGYWFSAILGLVIVAASAADLIRLLRRRKRSEGG